VFSTTLSHWPLAAFLLGVGFIRDGGTKMILGLALMSVSGLLILPR
jgi:hypothetical protein